jgi:hypothetical protein
MANVSNGAKLWPRVQSWKHAFRPELRKLSQEALPEVVRNTFSLSDQGEAAWQSVGVS